MAHQTGSIHHVGLTVPNLDVAEAFYKEALGLCEVYRKSWGPGDARMDAILDTPESSGRILFLSDGRTGLELFEFIAPSPDSRFEPHATQLGWMHIALEVQDIGRAYDKLSALGMSFKNPPSVGATGNAATYGRDPFGNLIEIVQFNAGGAPPVS